MIEVLVGMVLWILKPHSPVPLSRWMQHVAAKC